MDLFVRKHQEKINGTPGYFDRMLFRGYLPIQSGWTMAEFLKQNRISFRDLKGFLMRNADRINQYAKTMAAKHGRPFQYLTTYTRKEELARKMAEKEGIQRGLVCIYSPVEPCRTFCFRFEKGRPLVRPSRRKCLHIYFYFMDREFGLLRILGSLNSGPLGNRLDSYEFILLFEEVAHDGARGRSAFQRWISFARPDRAPPDRLALGVSQDSGFLPCHDDLLNCAFVPGVMLLGKLRAGQSPPHAPAAGAGTVWAEQLLKVFPAI